jgi:hypothetical protein
VYAKLLGYTRVTSQVNVTAGQSATLDFNWCAAPPTSPAFTVVGYGNQEKRNITGASAR